MLSLFTDLDHTLVYSHRSKPDVECVQVETMNGKPQSFMTEKTWKTLVNFVKRGKLQIIPVTTRTKEQYERLTPLIEELHIQYAMICNGAILLRGGEVDSPWLDESLTIAGAALDELFKVYKELEYLCGREKTHFPYGVLTYGVLENLDNVEYYADILSNKVDPEKCYIGHDRRKIYCIPISLQKGKAIKRFRERLTTEDSLAAGDSEFDVSMFYEVDYAVFPQKLLRHDMSCMCFPVDGNKILSDALCDVLLNLIE